MNIATLLQAAEYLDRRERGKYFQYKYQELWLLPKVYDYLVLFLDCQLWNRAVVTNSIDRVAVVIQLFHIISV